MVNDHEVFVDGHHSDSKEGIMYEAVCSMYPELVGLGPTVMEAYRSLKTQIEWHSKVDIYGRVRVH